MNRYPGIWRRIWTELGEDFSGLIIAALIYLVAISVISFIAYKCFRGGGEQVV